MSSTSENETEILLGNRHLLAIFFVLAVLLGIAFTGGYMVGRNSSEKTAVISASATDPAASTATSLETHALPPANDNGDQPANEQTRTVQPPPPEPVMTQSTGKEEAVLGTPKKEAVPEEQAAPVESPTPSPKVTPPPAATHSKPTKNFAGPQSGQTFLSGRGRSHGSERLSGCFE